MEILDQKQAAEYLKIGQSTLEKLRLSGRGPRYSKPLRRCLYRKADLDTWFDSHLRNSTSERSAAYPFPFGYITAARAVVDRFAYQIAELASKADGTRAVMWHRKKEDADAALAMIDEALGIGVAGIEY